MILRTIRWFFKAWPLLAVVAIFCTHLLLLGMVPDLDERINQIISIVIQLLGGIVVFCSINSAIGLAEGHSWFTEVKRYLADFPPIRKGRIGELKGVVAGASLLKARATIQRHPKNVEEHLKYLQEQIDMNRENVKEDMAELSTQINNHKKETRYCIRAIASKNRV